MGHNDGHYRAPEKSANTDSVYDALGVIQRNRRQIIRRKNTCVVRETERTGGTVFYDATNFFFEIEEPNGDTLDDAHGRWLHRLAKPQEKHPRKPGLGGGRKRIRRDRPGFQGQVAHRHTQDEGRERQGTDVQGEGRLLDQVLPQTGRPATFWTVRSSWR